MCIRDRGKAGKMVLHEGAYCGKCRLIVVVGGKRDYESHSRAKLRGRGYSRARVIVDYAKKSVGLTGGTDAGRESIKWLSLIHI